MSTGTAHPGCQKKHVCHYLATSNYALPACPYADLTARATPCCDRTRLVRGRASLHLCARGAHRHDNRRHCLGEGGSRREPPPVGRLGLQAARGPRAERAPDRAATSATTLETAWTSLGGVRAQMPSATRTTLLAPAAPSARRTAGSARHGARATTRAPGRALVLQFLIFCALGRVATKKKASAA